MRTRPSDCRGRGEGHGSTTKWPTAGGAVPERNRADDGRRPRVLTGGDVLVVGDRIAEVGSGSRRPRGALEIDASGGIVMPGMIDTHRHMWQTAMRGVRRRLDPHPVLRLVLPRARAGVPPGGRLRRQPVSPGTPSRPGSPRPSTGRTGCRPSSTPRPRSTPSRPCPAGSCWATATSRPVPWEWTPTPRCARSSSVGARRPATDGSWRSTSPATQPSRSAPRSRWRASSGCR